MAIASEADGTASKSSLKSQVGAMDFVPHDALKTILTPARCVVRTSEARPYPEVVLRAGISFAGPDSGSGVRATSRVD
jgi:D-ribose pyranose/furanose isomerase RbsD